MGQNSNAASYSAYALKMLYYYHYLILNLFFLYDFFSSLMMCDTFSATVSIFWRHIFCQEMTKSVILLSHWFVAAIDFRLSWVNFFLHVWKHLLLSRHFSCTILWLRFGHCNASSIWKRFWLVAAVVVKKLGFMVRFTNCEHVMNWQI